MQKTLVVLVALLVVAGLVVLSLDRPAVGAADGLEQTPAAAPRVEDGPGPEVELETPRVGPERELAPAASEPDLAPTQSLPPEVAEEDEDRAPPVEVRLSGRVVDGTLTSLARARIVCADPRASASSDAQGGFELAFEVEARRLGRSLPLAVELDGYARFTLEPRLPEAGGDLDLGDLILTAAGSVSGRVVDEWGHGVAEARVLGTTMGPLGWGARGQGPDDPLVEALSGADGSFRLPRLPEGEVRVWAGAEEHWWAYSDAVPVTGGRETRDVHLRLEALEPQDVIELLVLDPEHEPVAGATVHYFYHQDGSSGSGSVNTDAEGKYRRVLERRAAFDFCARDPRGRYRPAVARGVIPGTRDLVLVLGAARELAVRVRDTAGGAVPGFSVSSRSVSGDRWLDGASKSATEEGQEVVVFQLPTETFLLTAEAQGYESASLKPMSPDEVGASVEIELARLPGVSGVVRDAAGKPVEGAQVGLHEAIASDARLTVNGFPARSSKGSTVTASSGPEGRFTLTLRDSGRFYLRAEKDDYTPGEIGPLELSRAQGERGLEVALPEGGSIAGELLLEPGRSAAGLVVGVSRGDGFAVTSRTDARGHFRFDGLTPGRWYVKRCSEEIREGWTSSSSSDGQEAGELPWSCEVWPGRTTRFDLDESQAAQVVLEGRLLFSGRPRPEWNVRLHEVAESGQQGDQVADALLDSQGEFRLELGEPGMYQLRITGFTDSAFTMLDEQVELAAGRNEWKRDVALGMLEGNVAVSSLSEGGQLQVHWEAGGLRYSSFSNLADDGYFKKRVPAGDVRVSYGDLPPHEARVSAEGTTRVDLP